MSWNLRAKDRLAVMRLRYPFELNASAREGYVRYISGHLERIAHNAVRDRDIGMLSILCDEGLICSENILDVIDHAVSRVLAQDNTSIIDSWTTYRVANTECL